MTDSKPLAGKLALVTGASRGIGAATAELLAEAGAHVILVARTTKALEEIEERIHAAGGSATIAPLDLIDGTSIPKLATAIGERWDALDILVLNAGLLGSLTPVEHIDAKEYGRVLATNLLAPQALVAQFDPMLRKAERADVVAITSSVGSEPRAFWGAYGSSKAAMGARGGTPPKPGSPPAPACGNWRSPAKSRTASSRRRTSPRQSWSEFSAMRRPVRRCGSRPSS